jgi:hypothetical protein
VLDVSFIHIGRIDDHDDFNLPEPARNGHMPDPDRLHPASCPSSVEPRDSLRLLSRGKAR